MPVQKRFSNEITINQCYFRRFLATFKNVYEQINLAASIHTICNILNDEAYIFHLIIYYKENDIFMA